ncbi:TIGR03564 family F420-dependent LLM class oxidoreductase [Pseudonocardia eucalypti]|uniref:TIGR03564 family F420-dependent LLM class oxidoreductase n=1 Tax=Pseudonocardia eucalypti TaxID=648755 RepID=A0ABP9Q324_9PSEU|nr:F420-dependent oxidoreductase-like protein [Pseudonocardia eucalypti]
MRISLNIGGDVLSAPVPPRKVAAQAKAAEDAGFATAWATHFMHGTDSIPTITAAGLATSRIELGIGVVPTYPRHPYTLAHEAATVQSLVGGRLTLGVGVSHKPVAAMLGLDYVSPAEHMREYLEVLGALLTKGEVSHSGRFFRIEAGFNIPETSPVSVVVGALGPKMVRAAGELSDGAVTWLAGPRGLSEHIVPGLTKAASDAGRPAPRVIVGLPVAVADPDAARSTVTDTFALYGSLDNYRQQFERDGVDSVADLAVIGNEETVQRHLVSLRDAGATELWAVPFPVGSNAAASLARTTSFLASLAPEI